LKERCVLTSLTTMTDADLTSSEEIKWE